MNDQETIHQECESCGRYVNAWNWVSTTEKKYYPPFFYGAKTMIICDDCLQEHNKEVSR